MPHWAYYAIGAPLACYAAVAAAFIVAGRREDARAVAGFVPDCVVLFSRLLRDERLPRRHRLLVGALIPYLAMPFDLIPDFVPVAGQLDDAVIVALVLRRVVQANPGLIQEHWPGPPASLGVLLKLAGTEDMTIRTDTPAAPLPMELLVLWLVYLVIAVEMLVTYSRLPPSELYHVSHGGLAGGASRVLVFSNFSAALVAIAVLAVLWDRLARSWIRGAAVVGIALCAAVFWPGVVDQADLDAKPVNAIAAAGVLLAAALTLVALAELGPPAWSRRQPGDRLRVVVAAAALAIGLPWLAAELGFFLNGVPLLGWLFQTAKYLPTVQGLPEFSPAVHHGHHHGTDGILLLLAAILLSRVVPSIRDRALRVAVGVYVALMACYGIANIANDFWIEQVLKRGWTSWQVPDVLRPKLSVAWAVIVLGTAVVYACSAWTSPGRRGRGEG
jgi:uncharacterized membrane protein YkvA (DUF1232 family)